MGTDGCVESAAEIFNEMIEKGKTLSEIVDELMKRTKQGELALSEVMEEMTRRFDRGEFPEEDEPPRLDESMIYGCTLNMKNFRKN